MVYTYILKLPLRRGVIFSQIRKMVCSVGEDHVKREIPNFLCLSHIYSEFSQIYNFKLKFLTRLRIHAVFQKDEFVARSIFTANMLHCIHTQSRIRLKRQNNSWYKKFTHVAKKPIAKKPKNFPRKFPAHVGRPEKEIFLRFMSILGDNLKIWGFVNNLGNCPAR